MILLLEVSSLKVGAGSPGDHEITGDLVFLNDGVESKIPVNQSFAVISKPNSAVISADKMKCGVPWGGKIP